MTGAPAASEDEGGHFLREHVAHTVGVAVDGEVEASEPIARQRVRAALQHDRAGLRTQPRGGVRFALGRALGANRARSGEPDAFGSTGRPSAVAPLRVPSGCPPGALRVPSGRPW